VVGLKELNYVRVNGGGMFDKLWKAVVSLLVGDLLGLVMVPIALLFTKKEDDHLPHWFAYPWCNEWDSINGLANDYVWEKRYGKDGVRKFWPRFLWLAIRNRGSNLSQMLGKENPSDDETWRAEIKIPFTGKMFKCRWGYTSYYPGAPGPPQSTSLRVMPKKNFSIAISLRDSKTGN
jgi:hypothetical protein